MRVEQCYLCGSKNYKRREGVVRDAADINVLECLECGLVFLDRQIVDSGFYADNEMLSREFFATTKRDNGGSLKDNIREHEIDWLLFTQARVERLKSELVGKDILDFGSGHGQFLCLAKQYARSVAGVEVESQVEGIYKENGIPLLRSLEELDSGERNAEGRVADVESQTAIPLSVIRPLSGGGGETTFKSPLKNLETYKKFYLITLFN
ncbi:MAG: hypothetical protein PUB96_06740, partial [Helicobacteraceae bacterium]|nr:hypothetical protein [Helicobacteraceae bacterium]